MGKKVSVFLFIFLFSVIGGISFAKGGHSSSFSTSHGSSGLSIKPIKTYDVGGTKYKTGETYKGSHLPKVERSNSAKTEFLKSRGLDKTPPGQEIDHVIPLSKGGADKSYNMQLLPKEVHKQKTAGERKSTW